MVWHNTMNQRYSKEISTSPWVHAFIDDSMGFGSARSFIDHLGKSKHSQAQNPRTMVKRHRRFELNERQRDERKRG